jgi:hypothetical protein
MSQNDGIFVIRTFEKPIVEILRNVGRCSVIVNSGSSRRCREHSVGTTNGKHDKFEPFVWGMGKSLNISSWDREEEGLSGAIVERNMDFRLFHFSSQITVQWQGVGI